MRRAARLLTLVALAPLIMGGGGINPPPPGAVVSTRPTFRANILLDPHNAAGDLFGAVTVDATSTAKAASIALRDPKKGGLLSQVEFQALPNKPFSLGCDPTQTNSRFLYTSQNGNLLSDWVPPAALQLLFASQGVTINANNQPIITQILTPAASQCIVDPRNPSPVDGSASGLLLLDVVIGFQVIP